MSLARTRLLLNPTAGRAGRKKLVDRLRTVADLEIEQPDGPAALVDAARRAAAEGLERLIVAGGDGTVHQAIRGLAGTDCALGIVPLGSGNDLLRALGLPLDPTEALRRALTGPVRRIDLGRVDDRPFAGVAGIGFDGAVASFANERLRRFRGPWIYPYAVVRTLFSFRPPRIRIELGDRVVDGRFMLAAAANSPMFGGGMKIAPSARLDDGELDLILVESLPIWRFLAVFPRVYRGTHAGHPSVRALRFRRATIRATPASTVYADGEPLCDCGEDPRVVEVAAAALRIVA